MGVNRYNSNKKNVAGFAYLSLYTPNSNNIAGFASEHNSFGFYSLFDQWWKSIVLFKRLDIIIYFNLQSKIQET